MSIQLITLTASHNRREKTLNSLADLHSQVTSELINVTHVLVDDGSNDGTAEAVLAAYPDVSVLSGSGNLYWAGAMRFGWTTMIQHLTFDYLLVYNDDVRLHSTALQHLLSVSRRVFTETGIAEHVVVGALSSAQTGEITYGGAMRSSTLNPLRFERITDVTSDYRLVDTLNMNFTLIPAATLHKIGFLSTYFKHNGADYEYGLKLRKRGGIVVLAPGRVGVCERNSADVEKSTKTITLRDYLKNRCSAKEAPFDQFLIYFFRNGGLLWPLFFLRLYITRKSLRLLMTFRWF